MIDVIGDAELGLRVPTSHYIYTTGYDKEVEELNAWIDGFSLV